MYGQVTGGTFAGSRCYHAFNYPRGRLMRQIVLHTLSHTHTRTHTHKLHFTDPGGTNYLSALKLSFNAGTAQTLKYTHSNNQLLLFTLL